MSGTLRGKKPKETPKNLQWNNFQKNLAVAQTSFLQYFGKRESKQVPKEFSVANAKVKKLRENFDELVKASKYYIKASQGYSASNTSFVESLQTLSTTIGETHNLSPVLLKVAELETKIETSYAKMRDDLGRLVLFVEKFSNEKIDPARESYKSWNRSRLEYDAAKDRLDPLKNASHLSPINLLVAQTNYYHARVKEMTRYLNASDKMGAVLWERDFEFLQELINWMEIMHGILLTQYSLLYDQEQLTTALTETSNQRRTTYYTAKDEKARLKREKDIEAYRNRYQPLIALLSAEDLALVNALCVTAASEQEQTLESLVRILDAMKQTLPIIKLGITKEVSKTTTEATLFRGNTTATKLMTAFTKMTGREYLNRSLKDVMSEAIADVQKNGDKIEVDPSKMTNKDEAARQQSLDNLKNIVAKFLNAILASIDICPVPFRVMANHLQAEVVKRFPDSKYQSVAGFIFLRFFCPAILAPDTNGLYSGSLNEKERRLLILVSKVLQNIANGVDFGNKEPYMQDLNSFIHENVPQVHKFFDKLVTVPENIDDYEPLCSFQNAVSVELPSLHKKITSNLDKIGKCLIQYKQAECISPLAVILAELDEAVDPSLTPFIPPSALSAYNAGNNSKRETKDKEKEK